MFPVQIKGRNPRLPYSTVRCVDDGLYSSCESYTIVTSRHQYEVRRRSQDGFGGQGGFGGPGGPSDFGGSGSLGGGDPHRPHSHGSVIFRGHLAGRGGFGGPEAGISGSGGSQNGFGGPAPGTIGSPGPVIVGGPGGGQDGFGGLRGMYGGFGFPRHVEKDESVQ
ncbi:hypothetical protein COOONC_09028 [Cooperia oncophora]